MKFLPSEFNEPIKRFQMHLQAIVLKQLFTLHSVNIVQ